MSEIRLIPIEGKRHSVVTTKDVVSKSGRWDSDLKYGTIESQTGEILTDIPLANLEYLIEVLETDSPEENKSMLESLNLMQLLTLRELSVEYTIELLEQQIDLILPSKINSELPNVKLNNDVYLLHRRHDLYSDSEVFAEVDLFWNEDDLYRKLINELNEFNRLMEEDEITIEELRELAKDNYIETSGPWYFIERRFI